MRNLLSLLFILSVPAIPLIAIAQEKAYFGLDNYFSVSGLQPNKQYELKLGGSPIVRAANSNSCGLLKIGNSSTIKQSDRIEIRNEKTSETFGFENNSSIPVKSAPDRCNGTILATKEIWKDDKGSIYISGLTPSSAQLIRLLSSAPSRNIKANTCGMISLRLDPNQKPKSIYLNNSEYNLENVAPKPGILCRKGKMYVGYPPEINIAIAGVTKTITQWLSQNAIAFGTNTIIIISGNPNPTPNPSPTPTPTPTTPIPTPNPTTPYIEPTLLPTPTSTPTSTPTPTPTITFLPIVPTPTSTPTSTPTPTPTSTPTPTPTPTRLLPPIGKSVCKHPSTGKVILILQPGERYNLYIANESQSFELSRDGIVDGNGVLEFSLGLSAFSYNEEEPLTYYLTRESTGQTTYPNFGYPNFSDANSANSPICIYR